MISTQYGDLIKYAKEIGNGQVTKGALKEIIKEERQEVELKKISHLLLSERELIGNL